MCCSNNPIKARINNIAKLGAILKRYNYASWTSPSHYVLLIGLMLYIFAHGLDLR